MYSPCSVLVIIILAKSLRTVYLQLNQMEDSREGGSLVPEEYHLVFLNTFQSEEDPITSAPWIFMTLEGYGSR